MASRPLLAPILIPPEPADRRWSAAVVGVVVGAIAVSAFAYGGVRSWTQPLLAVTATFLGIAALLRWRDWKLPLCGLIAAAFVALVAVQLFPLPLAVIETVAPARAESLRSLGEMAPASATLSYYPTSTRQGLANLLLAVAVFAAVAVTARFAEAIKWLLTGLFVVGVAEAALAILQVATEAPGIYWDPAYGVGAWTGSLVNHSNFCQLINAAFGAGLGLLLVRTSDERHRTGRKSYKINLGTYLQQHGSLLFGLALLAAALAVSLSRGGVLGAGAGAVAVAIALGRERRLGPRAWGILVVPVVALVGLLMLGADTIYDRMETLKDRASYTDRLELSAATARVGLRHLATGTGVGTHPYVFPAYDSTNSHAFAEQADNDYAQLFEETGLSGVALMAAFFVTILVVGERTVRLSGSPVRYALYGTLYVIVACGVQSLTDFGQRLPAVFCASAALCGLVPAVAAITSPRVGERPAKPLWGRWALAAVVLPIGAWLGYQAWCDHQGEQWYSVAQSLERRVQQDDWVATPEDYVDLLTAAEMAASVRPNNVEYAYWLNAYRWQSFTIGANPADVAATPEGAEVARRLVDEVAAARRLCPTYGPLYTLEGQVLLALGDPEGFARVTEGFELAPNDRWSCYVAAYAACLHEPPDREQAAKLMERAVQLDPTLFFEAANVWYQTFADEELLVRLAADNPDRLRNVARVLAVHEGPEEVAQELLDRAEEITRSRVAAGRASANQIAATAASSAREGDLEEAVGLYRQALARQHANLDWRIALSDVLAGLERYEEAYREARLCFRLRPGWAPAKKRLEQLSLLVRSDNDQLPPIPSQDGD